MKAVFVPWYMKNGNEKYIFTKPCYCLTTYKKAWAIERLHSKTCIRKGFLRVIYTTNTMVTQAQFFPVLRRNSRLKKGLWFLASPNEATQKAKIRVFRRMKVK